MQNPEETSYVLRCVSAAEELLHGDDPASRWDAAGVGREALAALPRANRRDKSRSALRRLAQALSSVPLDGKMPSALHREVEAASRSLLELLPPVWTPAPVRSSVAGD